MRVSDAFPSKYLRHSDLQGREVTATIDHVVMEEFDDGDRKPIVYFQGKTKGFTLNKTNAATIVSQYGDDTDGWTGKPITIFESQTDFQGKQVACIRVKLKANVPGGGSPAVPPPPSPGTARKDLDDEIPF